jgi:hypothetical protein
MNDKRTAIRHVDVTAITKRSLLLRSRCDHLRDQLLSVRSAFKNSADAPRKGGELSKV